MPERLFVTSFSPDGYRTYGRTFLSGFLKHFPTSAIIHVFYEKEKPDIESDRVIHHDLLDDRDLTAFLARNEPIASRCGVMQTPDGTAYVDYRWQSTKFARKVAALTSPVLALSGWRVWIDADVEVHTTIPEKLFDEHFSDPQFLAYYLGRPTAWHTSECGYVCYNLDLAAGRNFLVELRNHYMTDGVFQLPEYHDSFVFDHLRRIYQKAGSKFSNIAEGHDVFHPWPQTVLGGYMIHHKGPEAKGALRPEGAVDLMKELQTCKNRYQQLIKIIAIYKPVSVVDVGTFDGSRALEMATEALKHKPDFFYIGFDLWEDITPAINAAELNVKRTVSLKEVEEKFAAYQRANPGFKYQLVKGDTKITVPNFQFGGPVDFAFIDGGHSVETLRSDYNALKNVAKLIVMDDYYTAGVDTAKWGCNEIIKDEKHAVLPLQDNYSNGQSIQMVLAGSAMEQSNKGGAKINLKTRNSVDDQQIQANITYAASLTRERLQETAKKISTYRPVRFLDGARKPHREVAVLIGASEELMRPEDPQYQKTWDELRALRDDPVNKLIVCKTSYRRCFEEGIAPWGCILLDPRDHVAACIDPRPEVIYFVASMCHPSTWDHLLTAGVRVVGYHALVSANEVEVIKQHHGKSLCVSGGTTSVLRGVSLFYHLGFRKIILYGATSNYKVRPDKPHGRSEKPLVNVRVEGREFLTDPELIAQSQDGEMCLKLFPDVELDFRGDGLLPHAVGIVRTFERENPGHRDLTDVRVGAWVNAFKSNDLELEALGIEKAITALRERSATLAQTLDALPDYQSDLDWENFKRLGE